MKLTILIPLPQLPFLFKAIVENIKETIGISDYKIIFLVTKIEKRFYEETKNFDEVIFFEINLNFKCKGVHLRLLDYAFEHLNLTEWVYVQHADMFWITKNWFNLFYKHASHAVAIMPSYYTSDYMHKHYKYTINNNKIIRCHDFCGLYHRPTIIENKLKFWWTEVKDCNQQIIFDNLKNIKIINPNKKLELNDFLDGSDLISLYFACKNKNLVVEVNDPLEYYHCWDLFGVSWSMCKKNNQLIINRTFENSILGLESYSWISSFYFDYNIWQDKIFSWNSLSQIFIPKKNKFIRFFEKYQCEKSSLKYSSDDVTKIIFLNKSFDIKKTIPML
jgi:hypothetical protein